MTKKANTITLVVSTTEQQKKAIERVCYGLNSGKSEVLRKAIKWQMEKTKKPKGPRVKESDEIISQLEKLLDLVA